MEEILSKSVDEINNNNLYYMHAFEKGNDAGPGNRNPSSGSCAGDQSCKYVAESECRGHSGKTGKDKKESREEQVFPAFFIHISPSFSHNNHTDKR